MYLRESEVILAELFAPSGDTKFATGHAPTKDRLDVENWCAVDAIESAHGEGTLRKFVDRDGRKQ